jgi:hypothetical protein
MSFATVIRWAGVSLVSASVASARTASAEKAVL